SLARVAQWCLPPVPCPHREARRNNFLRPDLPQTARNNWRGYSGQGVIEQQRKAVCNSARLMIWLNGYANCVCGCSSGTSARMTITDLSSNQVAHCSGIAGGVCPKGRVNRPDQGSGNRETCGGRIHRRRAAICIIGPSRGCVERVFESSS